MILELPVGSLAPAQIQAVEGRGIEAPQPIVQGEHLARLEAWLRSYRPEELFNADGSPVDELKALASKIRRRLSEAGIPFDRKRFSPHITLLRRARFTDDFAPYEEDCATWRMPYLTVERISLMRSDRTKHGMVYTEIR